MRSRHLNTAIFSCLMVALGCNASAQAEAPPVTDDRSLPQDELLAEDQLPGLDELDLDSLQIVVTPVGTAPYEVHEWGLIRFTGGIGEVSTSGHELRPPVQLQMHEITVDKPLIYFHPLDGFDFDTVISAQVSVTGGQIREAWPASGPQVFGERMVWPHLQITTSNCGAEVVPELNAFPCSSLTDGGVCETAEMRGYLQTVSNCLNAEGLSAPVLIYNGYAAPTQASPITIGESGRITNTSAGPVGPLWIPGVTGPQDGFRSFVRVDRLEPGESTDASGRVPMLHDGMVEDLRASLVARGLNDREAEDFIAAWRPNVLSPMGDAPDVLGLYDPATIDQLYPLVLSPVPSAVHRVLAFTNE